MDAHAPPTPAAARARSPATGVVLQGRPRPLRPHRARGRAVRVHLRRARRPSGPSLQPSSCRCCCCCRRPSSRWWHVLHAPQAGHKLFTGLFVFPLIIATVIILALIVLGPTTSPSRGRGDAPAAPRSSTASAADRSLRAELVAPSQRPPGHRAPRCPLFLRDRALAPPPAACRRRRAGASSASPRRCSCCCPQRAGARPERLLPVLRPHGAAPAAHPGVPAAADAGNAGLAAPAAACGRRRAARGAMLTPGRGGVHLHASPSRSGTCRRCTT